MLREDLKISINLALVSREMPRFNGGSLWHITPDTISVITLGGSQTDRHYQCNHVGWVSSPH